MIATLTEISNFSMTGQKLKKQARESRFAQSIRAPIHFSSFNLLNWNSSLPKMTPAEHSDCRMENRWVGENMKQFLYYIGKTNNIRTI